MKKVFLNILLGILVIVLLIGLTFGAGMLNNKYKATIGKESIDIDREVFETNKSHVHAMIEDISKYKMQLATTENEIERKAIITFINENYATFDKDLIENDSLRWFLEDVLNGEVK
jgi:hypothetical protein